MDSFRGIQSSDLKNDNNIGTGTYLILFFGENCPPRVNGNELEKRIHKFTVNVNLSVSRSSFRVFVATVRLEMREASAATENSFKTRQLFPIRDETGTMVPCSVVVTSSSTTT